MRKTHLLIVILSLVLYGHTQNKALLFHGSSGDYVSVENDDAPELNISTAITVEAWINASNWRGAIHEGTILGKEENTGGPSGYILRSGANGSIELVVGIGSGEVKATKSNFLSTDTWYHIAGTYDGTEAKLYINGVLEATSSGSGTIATNTRDLEIGRINKYTDRYFKGMIDEVRVWNVALDATTLDTWKDIPVTESHPNEANLVAYYELNDDTDPTVAVATYKPVGTDGTYGTNGTVTGAEYIQCSLTCSPVSNLTVTNITSTTADIGWTASGTATAWNIQYGEAGFFELGSGTILTSVTSNPYTLEGLSSSTNYKFYVQSNCGDDDASSWEGPFSFATVVTCSEVSDLSVSNITTTSADFAWTESGTASKWNVEYGEAGFARGTGIMVTETTTNPLSVSDLVSTTQYDFYVQAHCGIDDESFWVGPYSFFTSCDLITSFPWVEDFEGLSSLPICWSNEDGNWNIGSESYEGSKCIKTPYDHDGDAILSSPSFILPENHQITFWWKDDDISGSKVLSHDSTFFEISIDNGTNWITLDTLSSASSMSSYQEETHDLSSYTGEFKFRFRDVTDGSWSAYGTGVDFISIVPIPTCFLPTVLNAENITSNSADLTWVTGGATAWDVEIGEEGFTPSGIPTNENISTNPFTASSLNSDTEYEYYVRDNCGTDDVSFWTGPYSFTTLISCEAPTALTVTEIMDNTVNLGWTIGDEETEWNIEYGEADFTQGEGIMLSEASTNPTLVENLTPETEYEFYVQAHCGEGDESTWTGPLSFTTYASCPVPTDMTVEDITNSTATVNWNGYFASNWDLEIGEAGFTATGTPTVEDHNSNAYSATGLIGNTSYDVYVRADCGAETSPWIGPITLNTECDPISAFPYTEDFDGTWDCWSVINNDNDWYTWSKANSWITPTHSGTYAAHGTGNSDDYLISPKIVLSENIYISWWDKVEGASQNNTYDVLLSTTTKDLSSFTVNLGTFDCTNTSWSEHSFDLSAYNGMDVYIAFHQTYSAATNWGFGIDDVKFGLNPFIDASISDLSINGTSLDEFNAEVYTYDVVLPYGTTTFPTVAYTLSSTSATAVQTNETELPGTTTIVVTAEDASTVLTYTFNFTVALPSTDASLADLTTDGTTIDGFDASVLIYDVMLPFGTTTVPTVAYAKTDENATAVQTDATNLLETTTIVVTAEDGITELTYTIDFTVTPAATDATLSDLMIDGTTIEDFDATVLTYEVVLPFGTTDVPIVTYTKTDENATAVQTDATNLSENTIILVTAEDASTILTYTVNFTVTPAATDATLSDLMIDGTTIEDFDATVLIYDVILPYGTTTLPTVTYTKSDENATAVQTDATDLSENTIIVVTAEDASTILTYTVNFTVTPAATDATLSDLMIEGATVDGFDATVLTYDVVLPFGTTEVPTVTYTITDENATADQTDATVIPGSTTIVVTAEDGTTALTYTVNFTAPGSTDATLSDLAIDGTTVGGFDATDLSYDVVLPFGTTEVPTVTYTITDENATAVQTDATVLTEPTTIVVTAEDGETILTYTVNYTIAPPATDATLTDLSVAGSTVNGFSATTYVYEVILPFGTENAPSITYTLTDANATAVQTDATVLTEATTIVVTAEDGETALTYTVNFTIAASTANASLADLTIDGTTVENFEALHYLYDVILAYGTTTVPTVAYTLSSENATAVQTNATALPGSSTIVVTSEDGTTELTYTVNFTIAPNTDATLSDLSIDGTTVVDFDAATLTYDVELTYGTTIVPTVAYVINDVNATAIQTDATDLPGSTTVEVTAEDGETTLTYTINFTIAPNTDATLSDLSIDGTTVVDFDAATLTYDVELTYGTTVVPTIAYVINDVNATAIQTDATDLPGSTTVEVTAEDGETTLTYTINFTIAPNTDATLSDLSIDGTTVVDFDAATLTYDVELDYGTTVVPTVAYVMNDLNATAIQTDATDLPGSTTVEVTAEDEETTLTYAINFTIAANTDATLSDLSIDGTTVVDFDAATLTYEVELAYGTTVAPTVAYVMNDLNATAIQTDATDLPGSTTVEVTAEDEGTTLTYNINFTIAPNTDATLSDLSIDGTTVIDFDAATYTYEVELAYGTTIVPTVTYTPAENATVVITDATALPGTTTIVVTAEDGSTELTYTVNFTIAANTDASLTDLMVDGTTVENFDATLFNYEVELPSGTTIVPTVTYTTTDENATVVITDAAALPGTTTIVVTAEDGTTELTYTIALTPDPTSINIVENSTDINIYPNPNQGVFNLTVNISQEEMVNVDIINVNGQVVYNMTDVNTNITQSFNLSDLANGIYFLKVYTENEIITKRINISK